MRNVDPTGNQARNLLEQRRKLMALEIKTWFEAL
jgi:hypothetical protein